ncbi:alpha/beta fold hydrolase [Ruegeria lacuscaerulensis]|uniref:alpha/beta fold hydrolase n=1 Tax=Ruegeria lacuscaerulensis TaxID=55218 RepID=UPI00147D0ACC|nr:alpha/beta hydrolase [Ruegeria lacuscaerulensis]
MKRLWKVTKYTLLTIAALILLVLGGAWLASPGETPAFVSETGDALPRSIAEIRRVEIGELEQFVVIRGRDRANPALLVLHGGPGTSETAMFRHFNAELEDHFTVIHWDQRGAGNSYSNTLAPELMTIDRMVSDTHELTQYIKAELAQDKIYLLGHSWGSFLGAITTSRYPEDYIAYIGTGQISNQFESENLAYSFVLNAARQAGDEDAITALEELGPLELTGNSSSEIMEWVYAQRPHIAQYEQVENAMSPMVMMFQPLFVADEFTLSEKFGFFSGTFFSLENLFPQVLASDLNEEAQRFDIPVFFLQGAGDLTTSEPLARAYFDRIEAPEKQYVLFEKSGHNPPFEEPELFNQTMIETILRSDGRSN